MDLFVQAIGVARGRRIFVKGQRVSLARSCVTQATPSFRGKNLGGWPPPKPGKSLIVRPIIAMQGGACGRHVREPPMCSSQSLEIA